MMVFPGYTSLNSFGRRVLNGLKEVPLPDRDGHLVSVPIRMSVKSIRGFSGHSERRQLLSFVENLRPSPKTVYTMHGEEQSCEELARVISRNMRVDARAPMNLDTIRLK